MGAVLLRLAALDPQRGMLFCWVPVCFALGIGAYFALPLEPGRSVLAGLAVCLLSGAALLGRQAAAWPLVTAVLLVTAGLLWAAVRAHAVTAPVLSFRYYGPVEGRIVAVDRSASDAVRLTLDSVVLRRFSPDRTPARVRVSLHGEQSWLEPEPGQRVMMTAHLSPPSGPVEPGGYDFQRRAWFDRLGAVGYTRSPVLAVARGSPGPDRVAIDRLRLRISANVRAVLPGETGAFAAAITTGDRSGMGAETLEALRAANLAHLLAISGLHMGLVTGFVFMVARLVFAAVPGWALRYPIKAWAAGIAIAAGVAYLGLSGGNVATQRAFIMASVFLGAVIMGRRALTLRGVALAALIVLVLFPEALTEAGFQMSFAATTALVAAFRLLRDHPVIRLHRLLRPVAAVVISSAVAGAATAPIAAAHFNTVSHYGLVANLLSVPLMGTLVMPFAVLAACLAPFGLAEVGLHLMVPAIRWILGVAHWVAGLDGAVGRVPAPPDTVLPLLAFGFLVVVLWRGRARVVGLAPMAFAFALWAGAERPPLLISETGALMGVITETGRALSKPRGDGFSADSWLENDGDGADQETAAGRAAFSSDGMKISLELAGHRIVHLRGKDGPSRVVDACAEASLVILVGRFDADAECQVIDWGWLDRFGALAVYPWEGELHLVGARQRAGARLWSPGADRPASTSLLSFSFAGILPGR